MAMEIVKKLTLARMGINKETILPCLSGSIDVAAFLGLLTGRIKSDDSAMVPYLTFEGEFQGMNRLNGTEAVSPFLILPTVAEAALEDAFKKSGAARMEFALLIRAEKIPNGYKYVLGDKPYFKGLP